MKKILTLLLVSLALTCALKVLAVPQAPTPAASQKQQATKPASKNNTDAEEGERRFQQNCGRCHNPPDLLSPREVKAVVQHMRVRAMLSADDEKYILKYLAP
jgi:cytochrome c5